ncbi:MAG TPA: HAMP domain-containing sensor histidine kinase [Devosia sp.]|nr:HAMP domain-containing sensor histidine kinase [Devosia sp.]
MRVDADWIKSATARRILVHWADARPAWLWSHDGSTLLWRNAAARFFNGKLKKSGLKLSPEAVPIKGQVSRLIRLGAVGRSSLSRVQFLAGDKPVSTTCSCTPLTLADGDTALLLVGIDAVDAELLATAADRPADAMTEALLPPGVDYLVLSGGRVVGGSAPALAARSADPDAALPDGDAVVRIKVGADDSELVLLTAAASPVSAIATIRAEEGVSADESAHVATDDLADVPEPMLPMGLAPSPAMAAPPAAADQWVEPLPPAEDERALSSLFDRLAEDAELYSPLTEADETFAGPGEVATAPEPEDRPEPSPAPEAAPPLDPDLIATVIEYADDPEHTDAPHHEPSSQWMITGRGFRRYDPPVAAEPPLPAETVDAAPDAEAAERVSRYNFEELGRILTDRVSGEPGPRIEPEPAIEPRPPEGVINLNAETLVLNRLPLAILVFRDQQVLFANRALTELLGHDSVESLRAAGIASIFPGAEETNAGPVNRLVRRDGQPLPVAARLQSVSWQGRAALMLSAAPGEPVRGHEAAVRAFAEIAAEAREEGFLAADRAGIVTQLSGHGSVLLGRAAADVTGKPLVVLVSKADMEPLRQFLERPARFAETARPSLAAASDDGETEITLFAEGQAGVVTGYFGFLRKRTRPIPRPASEDEVEPSMLARLSRGIRRPLNTIIGFADLIRAAPGPGEAGRHVEYARDIRTAGLEIAVLADELDDFTRLRDGRYAPRPSDVDLQALLESCVLRVRSQAGAARVLVRSAISERLPRIRADGASLGQALLNLLASAIDQTPIGGSVILSAQAEEDGSIAIHVRDGAQTSSDLGERFVVFRDGVDKDGEQLGPVRSSVGLALTRSLLAVNACSLSVDPMAGVGTLFSLLIPADLVAKG